MQTFISLFPFNETDFERLIAWVNDEETLMQFAGPGFSFPLTARQLQLSLADKNRFVYKVMYGPVQAIIGHAETYFQDATKALLARLLIGNPAYRGKGFGQLMINELLAIAFSRPRIEEVSLNVFDWNIPAIKCYSKAGFRLTEGKTFTRQVKDKTWTAVNMCIHKKNWNPL